MEKAYIKIAQIPSDEKLVSTTHWVGYHFWDFKFPFYHYKEPRLFVATDRGLYEVSFIKSKE